MEGPRDGCTSGGRPDLPGRSDIQQPTCSIEGCDRRVFGRGWCRLHYGRWQRHGDPLYVRPKTPLAVGSKTCRRCGASKPVEHFSRRSEGDGLQSYCKDCAREVTSAWAEDNREHRSALHRKWADENPERVRDRSNRHRRRHPQKAHARLVLNKAIERGEVKRSMCCESCGGPGRPYRDGRAQIQAHHHDYSKPFDVRWLCQDCHIGLHRS